MSNQTSSTANTFPFFGILGIVFIILKLTDVIDWSWWWVTAPLWGPYAIALPLLVIGGLLALFVKRSAKKRLAAYGKSTYNDPFDHPFFKSN